MPLVIPDKRPAINHIPRAMPPWRDEALARTECGLLVAGRDVVELEEAAKLVRMVGKTRAREQLCVTCFETAANHEPWEDNPSAVIGRDCERYSYRGEDGRPINNELRAIAALIEAHRAEFDELLGGYRSAVSLNSARIAKRRGRR